jgi:hypothetical protein
MQEKLRHKCGQRPGTDIGIGSSRSAKHTAHIYTVNLSEIYKMRVHLMVAMDLGRN